MVPGGRRGEWILDDRTARRLIWVPIIHSQEDLGRLREAIQRDHARIHGEGRWDEHVRAVEAFWRGVEEWVSGLALDPRRVRLYQDGLPVCEHVEAIVADLARAGSANHRMLAEFAAAGATLEGTESPELLLLEYQLALKTLGVEGVPVTQEGAAEFGRLGRELLTLRDRFIADRIGRTLQPGETGLLFLGMLHAPAAYMPADIRLERLDLTRALQLTDHPHPES